MSPLKSQRSSAGIKKCLKWENWVDKCSSHPWWSEGWLETRHNISGCNTGNASVLAPSEVRHHLAVVLCDFKSLHGLQVPSFYSCASCRPAACCCGGLHLAPTDAVKCVLSIFEPHGTKSLTQTRQPCPSKHQVSGTSFFSCVSCTHGRPIMRYFNACKVYAQASQLCQTEIC